MPTQAEIEAAIKAVDNSRFVIDPDKPTPTFAEIQRSHIIAALEAAERVREEAAHADAS